MAIHVNADLYEDGEEILQLISELQEIKQSVNTQQALTIDYAVNILYEIAAAAE